MTLDYAGRVLLADLQEQYDAPAYQDVPDAVGEDDDGRLRLTLDAACRVVAVAVLQPDALRRPEQLREALLAAFQDADARRTLASLEASGALADYERAGELVLQGRAPLTSDRETSRRRREAQLAAGRRTPRPENSPRRGTSHNGYLTVQVAESGQPLHLEVDEEWLIAATPARLEAALREAFGQADETAGAGS